jgi:ferrous iron transport protein B
MHCETKQPVKPKGKSIKKLLLVGNPNVGKSVIFGFLTGQYVTVSNYPGDGWGKPGQRDDKGRAVS